MITVLIPLTKLYITEIQFNVFIISKIRQLYVINVHYTLYFI